MLKIKVVGIGKDKESWVTDACAHYSKLLGRFADIGWILIPSLKLSSSLSRTEIKKKEAKTILKEIKKGLVVALTDHGSAYDSIGFSEFLESCMSQNSSKNTYPELTVRQMIYSQGYRYRLHHRDLPGRPDIVFCKKKRLYLLTVVSGIDILVEKVGKLPKLVKIFGKQSFTEQNNEIKTTIKS